MNSLRSAPAIETKGLSYSFASTPAVDRLDLTVHRGEMFGLVGPDAAGKSTAIRMLCGILKPTEGQGRVLDCDLLRQAQQLKARIGYLSQQFTLYGDLTVDENIEFFAELHGVSRFAARREELLDFTRLTAFRKRLAQALSGGMKKKLALACTLIHTPELIFLDEPSTGVDPVSRGEFWNILSTILEQGVTILMTTPYLDEAERCHRVGLMHRGRVFKTGTPAEIKAALAGTVVDIFCSAPGSAYRLLRERWGTIRLLLLGDRVHFWSRSGEDELRECLTLLNERGLGPVRFEAVEPTLEDAFVGLLYALENRKETED